MSQKSNDNLSLNLPLIGQVHSPYGQKFAVPRQSALVPDVVSELEFFAPYGDPQAFIGIEGFSHLHLIFYFHQVPAEEFRAMVRPPRLGGNLHLGVFATRSPFRPARLGLSIVKLERIYQVNGLVRLQVSGADVVDGTPIVDIKPYIPFVDALPHAQGGFASMPPKIKKVVFTSRAQQDLQALTAREFKALEQILAQDPRPAYKAEHDDPKIYYAKLFGYNVAFGVKADTVTVLEAVK